MDLKKKTTFVVKIGNNRCLFSNMGTKVFRQKFWHRNLPGANKLNFFEKKVDFWIWLHVRHHIRKCACAIAKISAGPPMFRL